ncbi:hypothetical protein [Pantoea coffeiphila]|uniref:hypothetical protein n=1 Tax=Pantoea coffeiphila TaxID=1465635 RepID=UPI0019615422|nr:hypothetical protein [Pantoea coffeiphila]MBM7343614.1 hypothetical protein [Pantoea coffeiphila]
MKTLNQEQMNHVSGAGAICSPAELNYKNYNDFADYLSFMQDNKFDPLSPKVPGLQAAYKSWCKEMKVNPLRSAILNGWSYRGC